MRPEEKQWWRDKQKADYNKAWDRFGKEQEKFNRGNSPKGGGSCLILILFPLVALGIAAKILLL